MGLEDDLLSDFVDTINQYGLASIEFHDKYQSIVEQFPHMEDLLHETLLIADYYKNNKK